MKQLQPTMPLYLVMPVVTLRVMRTRTMLQVWKAFECQQKQECLALGSVWVYSFQDWLPYFASQSNQAVKRKSQRASPAFWCNIVQDNAIYQIVLAYLPVHRLKFGRH